MIVKITRGGSATGLLRYLVGPGRSNEHTSPHLVGGSAGTLAWYSTDELSGAAATQLGKLLEQPRRSTGTAVTVPVQVFDEAIGQRLPTGERRDAHVWHCSLSLPPTTAEGEPVAPLEDEVWGAIAREFVEGLGFSTPAGVDGGVDGGTSGCRWVAVHHGQSVNGGDHIHLAVQLVREDGTKASTHNDYKTASRVVAELEAKHGLEVVTGRGVGRSARPEIRGEVEQAKRAGTGETYSRRLSRTVRACATASATEDEFVRRCRGEGLWVRPRFAAGTQDVITGFAVAEQPVSGEGAVWKAAGNLGRDLTLPRLRENWPDAPKAAQVAAGEWQAAWRGQKVVTVGRETGAPSERLWQIYTDDVAHLVDQLASLPIDEHATWARIARETSGVLAAWSLRTETAPGPLAEASDQLARSAAIHRRTITARPGRPVSMRGPAYLLMQLAADPSSATGQALLIRQLANTVRALYRAQVATVQAREAIQLATIVRGRLAQIAAALPEEPARRAPATTQATTQATIQAARPERAPLMGPALDEPAPRRVSVTGESDRRASTPRRDPHQVQRE